MPAKRATGAALRRKILDKARRLLVTEGYDSLSMRKIAREASCSATSIYIYFDSKDVLTHTLIEEGVEQLYEALSSTAASVTGSPRERLEGMSRAYVAFGLSNREYYEIMFQLHPERMERYPAESYRKGRRALALLVDVIEEGRCTGGFRADLDPFVAGTALWTALHGLVSLSLSERIDARIADAAFIDAAIAQAVRGLLA